MPQENSPGGEEQDDIRDDVGPEVYATPEDFEADWERKRTPEEQAAHEMFMAASLLAEDTTQLTVGPGDGTGERINPDE